jgi:hypothetical protein
MTVLLNPGCRAVAQTGRGETGAGQRQDLPAGFSAVASKFPSTSPSTTV